MGPCEGVDWFSSEWNNDCSQQCGNGIQTRHVVCSVLHPQQPQQLPSQYYSYEHPQYQNASKRRSPSSSELEASNEATANPGESQLETPISSPATTSFQFQESSQILSCEENKMPPEERECFSDRACGDPRWFTGDWSQCTASCANGVRTRQVLCVLFTRGRFKVVQDEHCALDTKPGDKETCLGTQECPHRWFTTEWSECSALCGGGMQKRSVSCRHAANWTLTSSLCADKDRPVERKSCNEQKCTLTPVSPSAASNYTRPIQQDYGPTSEPSPSPVTPSHHHHRHQKSQAHTTTSSPPSIDEDKEGSSLKNQIEELKKKFTLVVGFFISRCGLFGPIPELRFGGSSPPLSLQVLQVCLLPVVFRCSCFLTKFLITYLFLSKKVQCKFIIKLLIITNSVFYNI